jgi:hypothetical protein
VSADPTFHELCREMAEGYTRAGLEPAFQQWHLEPTSPRPLPGKPWLQEEFTGEGWHPALTWQDATGRTRVDRATRPGWLGLDPPEDCDLWPEIDLNAPRLVATVRGDFVLQTRVELGHQAAVSAGLLVWRDERHFARLELRPMLWWRDDQHFAGQALRSTRWERAAVSLHACVAGRFRLIGRGHCERRPMWLRLERVGEELRGLCSADGERWLAAGSVRLPRGETEQVGLAAIQRGPISRAWFDQLLIWQGADE